MDNEEIKKSVKEYFTKACEVLDRTRYQQEPAYVDALIGRLDGTIYLGDGQGFIRFKPTVVADRGPASAESLYGADFAIVFESTEVKEPIKKAIFSQAKNGDATKLSKTDAKKLDDQCAKMAIFTKHYMVFEAPKEDGAMPTIRLGKPSTKSWDKGHNIRLDDYFLDYILSCKHGDRRENFIRNVAASNLKGLTVDVNGINYTPTPPTRKKKNNKGGLEP
ncbi:hypothetical protein GOP97_18620 [Vibrio cholerae]|uniref:hypothetical protein n=1 Tax=Vibrio cholerae TaxID=666 RepID=UPI0028DA1417|nr:hypothetical protein [Vibrio cholerae]ELJ8739347.1 hypothetical protein [Vibrio cholerae]MEB5557749.1 hypothetical protein [Vibrio cholerae]